MHNRRNRFGAAAGVLLGGIIGACGAPAERGPACWVDHASSHGNCNIEWLRCIDDASFDDDGSLTECSADANRCRADAALELERCEHRPGCIAEASSCREACGALVDAGARIECGSSCDAEFRRCAPWYRPDCEERCERDMGMCQMDAAAPYQRVDCEEDQVDCIHDCYER